MHKNLYTNGVLISSSKFSVILTGFIKKTMILLKARKQRTRIKHKWLCDK